MNLLVFLVAWLNWYIGIPAAVLLLAAFYKAGKNILLEDETIRIPRVIIVLAAAVIVAWVLLSGMGGLVAQKNDMHWRNAIFHDLINYSWPVRYDGPSDSSLSYYFAFWLIPALIGKAGVHLFNPQTGWAVANAACVIYSSALLMTITLLLISHLKVSSVKKIIGVLALLIVFSGMDIVPLILARVVDSSVDVDHIEWWNTFQYSSNSTQLSWVFNQALPAWLVTSLMIHEKSQKHFAYLGGLLLPYGPLPFIGLFFLMVAKVFRELINAVRTQAVVILLKDIFTAPNLIACAVIYPVFTLFYANNSAASGGGLGLNSIDILMYILFVVFEFLIYTIIIWRSSYKKVYFLPVIFGLAAAPFFTLGNAQDFCMRASIPLLFMLMVFVLEYLLASTDSGNEKSKIFCKKAIPLVVCLTIGALTPFVEYRATLRETADNLQSDTSMYANYFGTLDDENMARDNFVTKDSSSIFFYKYLSKK